MATASQTKAGSFKITQLKIRTERKEVLAAEVRAGLTKPVKSLPSKLFYDDVGSSLFNRIMRMPEYYPARAEREILTTHAKALVNCMPDEPFVLMDLGSGDGTKTRLLLEELQRQERSFTYVPVDISAGAVEDQIESLKKTMPGLEVEGVVGEFFNALADLRWRYQDRPWFVLFLGGNIGNFESRQALGFLRNIYNALKPGDHLLGGFDLQKDPNVIRKAYDDPAGITAAFNYNLLLRLNRELGADFDLNKFVHYATYEPQFGVARSFLLATEEHTVRIADLNLDLHFKDWEPIHTENSYKYTPQGLADMAETTGFKVVQNYYDANRYFTDAVWLRT